MKYLKIYCVFLFMLALVTWCSSKEEEYTVTVYEEKNQSTWNKVANAFGDVWWDLQRNYYSQPFRGYWKFYNVRSQEHYQIYHFTDSADIWINQNVLEKYYVWYYFTHEENDDYATVWIGIECGGTPYEYEFRNDSLFFYYHRDKKRFLEHFAVRASEEEVQKYSNFSTNYVKVNPLKLSSCEIFEQSESSKYTAFINIGKPYDKRRCGDAHRLQVNDAYISCLDVPRFVFTESDKLEDYERPNLELYLNADKDTPPAMIDSIKTIFYANYQNLKLYRVVQQVETGKIGRIYIPNTQIELLSKK